MEFIGIIAFVLIMLVNVLSKSKKRPPTQPPMQPPMRPPQQQATQQTQYVQPQPLQQQYVPPQPAQYVPPQPAQYVPPQPAQYVPPQPAQYVPQQPAQYAPQQVQAPVRPMPQQQAIRAAYQTLPRRSVRTDAATEAREHAPLVWGMPQDPSCYDAKPQETQAAWQPQPAVSVAQEMPRAMLQTPALRARPTSEELRRAVLLSAVLRRPRFGVLPVMRER